MVYEVIQLLDDHDQVICTTDGAHWAVLIWDALCDRHGYPSLDSFALGDIAGELIGGAAFERGGWKICRTVTVS